MVVKHYRIVWHPQGQSDVDEIYLYILATRGPAEAGNWQARIDAHVAGLSHMPAKFVVYAPAPPRPVHKKPVKNHVVYHEVFEVEQTVRVLYVWDGRRNAPPDLQRRHDPLV